jgi:hypothetical protein
MKWSDHREELVLGRCLDPLVVLINIYKNRYAIVRILLSMFGGFREGYSWRGFAAGQHSNPMAQNRVKDLVARRQQET